MALKRISVELEEKIKNRAKSKAYREGKTIKTVIVDLINGWLSESKKRRVRK